jgi:uncharacterized protein YecA (UPF0149 family)
MKLNKSYLLALWILVKTKIKYIVKVRVLRMQDKRPIIADYVENPMLKYPRNVECWCDSGRKAKHCCLPKQSRILPQEIAKQARVLFMFKQKQFGFE